MYYLIIEKSLMIKWENLFEDILEKISKVKMN